MSDIYKFPNGGYDVVVLNRHDIISCIEDNITDKELMLSIVEQCEFEAAEHIRQGRWAGIPFIGNIRVPKNKLMEDDPEQQALIEEAKETLDPNQYIYFRKTLNIENSKKVKQHRYYNYITSIAVNRNKNLYRKLCEEKGEHYAKIFLYSCYNITSVDNEYINLEYGE